MQIKNLTPCNIKILVLIAFLCIGSAEISSGTANQSFDKEEYTGRYGKGTTDVVYFEIRYDKLTFRPIFWHSIQRLVEVIKDSFVVDDRPERKVNFIRNASGIIESVAVIGLGREDGIYKRLSINEHLPVELLFMDDGEEELKGLLKQNECEIDKLLLIGRIFFERYPSRILTAEKYLKALAKEFPESAQAHALLGRVYVAVGKRKLALSSFQKAFSLDPKNQDALTGLQRLHAISISPEIKAPAWRVPFLLDELFKKPTRSEIKAVRKEWMLRDLSAQDVHEEFQTSMKLSNAEVNVRIVSHRVHKYKHYGAIIVPAGALKGCCPVILEAKGVSWDYSPLDLVKDLYTPSILGSLQSKFVIIVPSFRGEKIILDSKEFSSEGDRTDSWDGATDDAIALLNVALLTTPEIDLSRICAFGKSRGGSVALLAGIRDQRIKSIIDWAGPVDWFQLMNEQGWTQKELVEDGLRIKSLPGQPGGQFIERFLKRSIEGKSHLKDVRLHMIASSPLYHVSLLPPVQLHYGIEDWMVPVANGGMLSDALRREGHKASLSESYFYENAGHDLDLPLALERSRKRCQVFDLQF